MGILSNLAGLAGGIPWVKIGIATALLGGLTAGVMGIEAYGANKQIVKQLKADAKVQHEQDQQTIEDLKASKKRDIEAIQKERDDALKDALDAQKQLDVIKNVKPRDNGPTRPVLRDTLEWLRVHNSGDRNQNGENPASRRTH